MRLLALSLLTVLLAFGADVTGKWKATFEGQNGTREVTFNFQVDRRKAHRNCRRTSGRSADHRG